MQNKYFGDIHDFYKYYLLKRISGHFSLGIHWCLVPNENSKDGNKKLTEKENRKDPKLFGILNGSINKNIENIKPYFSKTKYFEDILEKYHLNGIYQKNAFEKLFKQDIIFFDPDNGFEVLTTNNKNRFKYLSYDVIEKYWLNGNSMIIYQHLKRDKNYLDEIIQKITELLNIHKIGYINTVRRGHVDYIFIIQKKHRLIHDIIEDFVNHNNEYKILEI